MKKKNHSYTTFTLGFSVLLFSEKHIKYAFSAFRYTAANLSLLTHDKRGRLERFLVCYLRSRSKKLTFDDATTGFPAKWYLSNDCRNSRLMKCYNSYLESASDWSWQREKFSSTNQKLYRDVCTDTSSVWNFCARFSNVISPGNQ